MEKVWSDELSGAHLAMTIECPVCGAPVGERCTGSIGQEHYGRIQPFTNDPRRNTLNGGQDGR